MTVNTTNGGAKMFRKYIGEFGKAEAEWVREVLDMHDGDQAKAQEAVIASINRIIEFGIEGEMAEFDRCIEAACFASRDWWHIGLRRLAELESITRN